jgi:hypothetical protein
MTWVPAVRVRPTPPAVAHRDQAAVVGLKSVDSRESLLGRIVTRDCDAGLAESLPVLREPLPEGDEDDHFLSSCKHVLYALLDGFVLGLVERRRSLADMLTSKYEWPSQKNRDGLLVERLQYSSKVRAVFGVLFGEVGHWFAALIRRPSVRLLMPRSAQTSLAALKRTGALGSRSITGKPASCRL